MRAVLHLCNGVANRPLSLALPPTAAFIGRVRMARRKAQSATPKPAARPRRRTAAPQPVATAPTPPPDERVLEPKNAARPVASETESPQSAAYFNRELSWLAFNRRVLEQAQSDRPMMVNQGVPPER